MRYNLKNFVKYYQAGQILIWKEGFEKELREYLILEKSVAHIPIRQLIKEILGDDT